MKKPAFHNSIKSCAACMLAVLTLGMLLAGCGGSGGGAENSDSVVVINEVMSNNSVYAPSDDGSCYDWVELHNTSDRKVSLRGYYLTDNENKPGKGFLGGQTIEAGGYLVVYCSGREGIDGNGRLHVPFKISSKGESVLLTQDGGRVSDRVDLPKSPENVSYGRNQDGGGEWVWFSAPTPGERNGGSFAQDPSSLDMGSESGVFINEILYDNTFILYDSDGDYSDWVELYNPGDDEADISGYILTDNLDSGSGWRFPSDAVIPPDGYLVVFCSGKDKVTENGELHTNFKLSGSDPHVALVSKSGDLASIVALPPNVPANVSIGFPEGVDRELPDSLRLFSCPTPGGPNNTASFSIDRLPAAVSDGDGDLQKEVI